MSPFEFRPLTSRRRSSLTEQWSADAGQGSSVRVLSIEPGPEAADDTEALSPGSPGLAAIFEELPIEWVTGEPAIENRSFEAGDGLEILSEAPLKPIDDQDRGFAKSDIGDLSASDTPHPQDLTAYDPNMSEGCGDELVDPETDPTAALPALDSQPISLPCDETNEEARKLVSDEASDEPSAGDSGHRVDSSVDASSPHQMAEPVQIGISEAEHLSALEAARAVGREEGLAEARRKLEAQAAVQQEAMADMIESIRSAAADSQRLFEPLKRLALHLAQQLVRGELSLSGDAINRLVDQCLLEIDQRSGREVVLSLNPDDLERWRRRAPIALESVTLRPDPALSIGSVRVSAGESVIEDLIEHRLQHLANRLLGEAGARNLPRMTPLHLQIASDEDISDAG